MMMVQYWWTLLRVKLELPGGRLVYFMKTSRLIHEFWAVALLLKLIMHRLLRRNLNIWRILIFLQPDPVALNAGETTSVA